MDRNNAASQILPTTHLSQQPQVSAAVIVSKTPTRDNPNFADLLGFFKGFTCVPDVWGSGRWERVDISIPPFGCVVFPGDIYKPLNP